MVVLVRGAAPYERGTPVMAECWRECGRGGLSLSVVWGYGFGFSLTSEYGTYKTVKARLWPWLSGKSPKNV